MPVVVSPPKNSNKLKLTFITPIGDNDIININTPVLVENVNTSDVTLATNITNWARGLANLSRSTYSAVNIATTKCVESIKGGEG